MHLECPTYSILGDSNNKGKCITLDLERMGTVIQEGVDVSIRDVNDDVYAYLFASVLDYYVSQNFVNTKIDIKDYNGMLYSNKKRERRLSVPMLANLCNFNNDPVYWKIIDSILCNHNVGKTSEQLINNLKNKIFNQQIDDFDSLIDYSSDQCQYVLKK